MKALSGCLIGLVFGISASAEPLLEGLVRLSSGQPVADAQVQLFDLTNLRQGAIARAMTDGTGYFALPLAALTGRALPVRFTLGPNYPNPFNPSTIIPYQIPTAAHVRLEVFNVLGQRVATLVDAEQAAGAHTAQWDATDAAGRAVGAGVYIYRLRGGEHAVSRRMVLIDGQAGMPAAGAAGSPPMRATEVVQDREYGLVVSGAGIAPYLVRDFRVQAGMAPVDVVVEAHPAGKATQDDCAFCDLFATFNDQQEEEEDETTEEEAATENTSSEGGPDLIFQASSVSDSILTPGQAFTLRVTMQNQGDEQAAATTLRYYRSNNSTITASDTEVDTSAVGALNAAATHADSIVLTAPTKALTYFYGACIEPVANESNTDNNCSTGVRVTVEDSEIGHEGGDGDSGDDGSGDDSEDSETGHEGGDGDSGDDSEDSEADDHSNRRSGATSLPLGSSRSGEIETGDDVDYFSVQVSESGTLTIYTTGSLDTKGRLESSSGSTLTSNDDGGRGSNFRIERSVSAGTYYVRVESYSSRTGSYTLHASFESSSGDDDGDSGDGGDGGGDGDVISLSITNCSGSYWFGNSGAANIYISGTVYAHRSVSSVRLTGYANGKSVGIDFISGLSAGESESFGIWGIISTSGSSLNCSVSWEATYFTSAKVTAGDAESSEQVRVQGSLSPSSALINRKRSFEQP